MYCEITVWNWPIDAIEHCQNPLFHCTFLLCRQSAPLCLTDLCEPWCATVNALEGNIYRNIHLEWNFTPYTLLEILSSVAVQNFQNCRFFWSSKEPWAKNTFQSFRIRGLGLTKINSKPFRASLPKNIPANSTVFTPEDDRMFPENNQFSNKKGVLESCP